ncbi:MAG: DEAD/DEAH box helicase family protein [Candidatus Izemoplasmatales bacterium]|nr:DEAD/DEAH box helicase family protein [Candidatus Izemoplasmatales bacterium]
MELKRYQKKVIRDISEYLYQYKLTGDSSRAYEKLWLNKGVNVGFGGIQKYVDDLEGAPQICIKVPTGGGKTFIASSAIKTIYDFLPTHKKVVLWLVPSETILSQTLINLKNPEHPYRQKLNSDFSSRIEIYSKSEALNGQNFNTTTVNEQLSIFVMSFDSFRIRNKEGRKVYQENSNLSSFTKDYSSKDPLVEGADITSLIQVFNHLNPVIIVDESHNATSDLSLGMLKDLNPALVLDFTATPRINSNVISFVDAMQLKKEKMVKLPVIVYNRPSQKQVIVDALDLRSKLEKIAYENRQETGVYIRPIVLFQAQPKTDDDNTTFEVLKENLIKIGIPKDEIAIKTANVNELKNIDLLDENCKVKYIVTVNALKEGWDCPFAYILASLSNKTSTVDVEQIVGRILRQPYTRNYENNLLNMSYVLTSSNDFNATLTKVLAGLNSAGFSEKDYRAFDVSDVEKEQVKDNPKIEPFVLNEEPSTYDFNPEEVKEELETTKNTDESTSSLNQMMNQATTLHENYTEKVEETNFGGIFGAEKDLINVIEASYDFINLLDEIKLPQFFTHVAPNIFNETETLVTKELLLDGFTLVDKSIPTNLAETTDEVVKVDIEESIGYDSRIRTSQMSGRELSQFKAHLEQVPDDRIAHILIETIYKQLDGMNSVTAKELKNFITRIISSLKQDELIAVRDNVFSVGYKIKQSIDFLKEEYAYDAFKKNIDKGAISVKYTYTIPNAIGPNKSTSSISKSFYHEEAEDMNNTEIDIIRLIAGMPNIKCWHRIMDRKPNEFYINGYINHYPDFWIITNNGNIVLLEVKGEQFGGKPTKRKAELGKIWQNESYSKFKYFMVYKDRDMNFEGAYKLNDFIEILRSL